MAAPGELLVAQVLGDLEAQLLGEAKHIHWNCPMDLFCGMFQ